jgi:anti-sigma B factor antagonist
MQLTVTRTSPGHTTLTVAGDVDLATADELRTAGLDGLSANPADILRIDLSGITFLDSSALNALISIHNAGADQVVLVAPSKPAIRILQLTALDEVFAFEANGDVPRAPADPRDAPVILDGPLSPA